jgi:hypothetical protein
MPEKKSRPSNNILTFSGMRLFLNVDPTISWNI